MMKIAVFCPRLPRESEGAWQLRMQACRVYLRQQPKVESQSFDTLEHLQIKCRRHPFRQILVAQAECYAASFWEWAAQHRAEVVDVMRRPEPQTAERELAPA